MLTQIWSACTDTFFSHFRSFFAFLSYYWPQKLKFGKNVRNTWTYYPLTHVYHYSRSYMYGFWDMKFNRQNFFVIWGNYFRFFPSNILKNEKIKNEKNPGDIIILQKCTKNHDHMLYCSWDMVREGCNCYFSSWAIFCLFNH